MSSKYGLDNWVSRVEGHRVSTVVAEDRVIREKRSQLAKLESRGHYFKGESARRLERAVAHTLPLECFGVVEYVKVVDLRTSAVFRVPRRGLEDFFDSHPRPYDLSLVKGGFNE